METAARMMPVDGPQLTPQDFEKVGGLKGAINTQAEDVFQQFPEEQAAIQRMFQRLTDRGEGEKPVRRPETLAVLKDVTGLSMERLDSVVKEFVENGLLVTRPIENGEIELDLPHECLAWKWERLAGWIEEEVVGAKSLRFLRDSAANRLRLMGSVLTEAGALYSTGRLDGPWALRYLSPGDLHAVYDCSSTALRVNGLSGRD